LSFLQHRADNRADDWRFVAAESGWTDGFSNFSNVRTADLFPGWEALPQPLIGKVGVMIARMLGENRPNKLPKNVIGRLYIHRSIAFLKTSKEYLKIGWFGWRTLWSQCFVPSSRYD
jgi:hypothetical protein